MTLKKQSDKPSLNFIRYHHFLDPAGTNRDRLESMVNYLTKSWLDWYVANNVDEKITQEIFDIFKKTEKNEDEVEKWFSKEKRSLATELKRNVRS